MNMTISANGLDFIKGFESFRANAYKDVGGVWTIGYGHTGELGYGKVGGHIVSTSVVTLRQAYQLLFDDIAPAEAAVNAEITQIISQNQFDALVSICFNVGVGVLRETKYGMSIAHLINIGEKPSGAAAFLNFNHVGDTVVQGLLNRRKAEQALFMKA